MKIQLLCCVTQHACIFINQNASFVTISNQKYVRIQEISPISIKTKQTARLYPIYNQNLSKRIIKPSQSVRRQTRGQRAGGTCKTPRLGPMSRGVFGWRGEVWHNGRWSSRRLSVVSAHTRVRDPRPSLCDLPASVADQVRIQEGRSPEIPGQMPAPVPAGQVVCSSSSL